MTGAGGFAPGLFAGRRYGVLGLGRNGAAASRRLAAMGATVQAWDDGEAARAALLATGGAPGGLTVAQFGTADGLDALVLSPGIASYGARAHPLALDAAARGVPVLSDAALLFEAVRASGSRARFAGITGTNGKSTTTVLLAHLLSEGGIDCAAGGNLGPASLSLPLLADDGVYVLEMSSYMLERVPTLGFDATVLLNLSPDHLDRHGDMDGYVAAKSHVFDHPPEGALALIGVDDPWSAALAGTLGPRVRTLSTNGYAADWRVRDGVIAQGGQPVADLADAPALRGVHNHQNAAAAVAMALHLGADPARVQAGLRSFAGLAHRQKRVATVDGIEFVDDSKATNADAAARALAAFDRCVWIAGGQAKAGGIESLAPWFDRIAHACLIGRDAPMLSRTLADHAVPHTISATLGRAVGDAFAAARRHAIGTVLLSPACASFDQFADFEARGRAFASLAASLGRDLPSAVTEDAR